MTDLPQKSAAWNELAQQIFAQMQEWHHQHREASFDEIEAAIDQGLARLRAQILTDSIQTAHNSSQLNPKILKCEKCGVKLYRRGKHSRQLITQAGQTIRLERDYLVCPDCGQ